MVSSIGFRPSWHCPHACAVCHPARRCKRAPPCQDRLLRLVQPRLFAHRQNYEGLVARLLRRAARYLVIYAAIIVAVAVVYIRMPISFLPGEDQGTILVNTQLPPGAAQERTRSVMQQVEGFILKTAGSAKHGQCTGLQLLGSGPKRGTRFCHASRTGQSAKAMSIRPRRWPVVPLVH